MPYPCSGPIVSRVFSTISASVPCQTSVLSPMQPFHLLVHHRSIPFLLWESNMNGTGERELSSEVSEVSDVSDVSEVAEMSEVARFGILARFQVFAGNF